MKDINKSNKVIPKISKPTEEQIQQTKKMVKDKYDIDLPTPDTIKLVGLIKELDWWLKVDKGPASPKRITDEMATEFKDLVKKTKGEDITKAEAYDGARGLLVLVPIKEKQRISDETRAIIVTHRKVLLDPVVSEKTAKLLRLHYGFELTDSQLDQLVQFLTKTIWYEEGLDESLEKCLDDLLIYADKRKRGKRVNGLNLHDKVRQAFDKAVSDLKLAEEFDPLYRVQD